MKLRIHHFTGSKHTSIDLPNLPGDSVCDIDRFYGLYAYLGRTRVALFVYKKAMWIGWDNKTIEVTSGLSVSHSQDGSWRTLTISDQEIDLIAKYENVDPPVSTPYYSEDEEDTDFGLWLRNVLSTPERNETVVARWEKGFTWGS